MIKLFAYAAAQAGKFDGSNIFVAIMTLHRWLVLVLNDLLGLRNFAGHDAMQMTLERNTSVAFYVIYR
jgi:hypothetical protein